MTKKERKTLAGSTEVYEYMCSWWRRKAKELNDRPKEPPFVQGTIRNKLSMLEIPILYQSKKHGIIYCDSEDIENWLDSNFVGSIKE